MNERLKFYAFIFLGFRALIDAALAGVICYQADTLVPGIALLSICGVFYVFLFFGIKYEGFRGRYGQRVFLWREPMAYWFVVGFLVAFHLCVTTLMASGIDW